VHILSNTNEITGGHCTLYRAASLEGAVDGLRFFFQPVWEEVLDPKVTIFTITHLTEMLL
jgi:SNF family Na+-dependent transporter